jgi:osmotically-inducible protein OsmY
MRPNNFLAAALIATTFLVGPSSAQAAAAAAAAVRAASDPRVAALEAGGIDTSRLQLIDVEGIVIVRGKVPNRASIEQTTQILRGLGCTRVGNVLQVSARPADEEIRRAVERALTQSPSLDGCRFKVASNNGVVTVGGTVRDEMQKEVATDIVENVDGVRSVVNAMEGRS